MSVLHRRIPILINDQSCIGHARRQAAAIAESLAFSETAAGNLGIIVTEAARNIALHAGSGEIVLAPWTMDGHVGVDVLALDRGPGIADIARALEDGFSTAGTAGTGLGAMRRLAQEFQVYSILRAGTVVFARVFARQNTNIAAVRGISRVGVVNLAMQGEEHCGDAWKVVHSGGRSLYMVADGLGHGKDAALASSRACEVLEQNPSLFPEQLLDEMHRALRKTRGAAISIATLNVGQRTLHYAGAGNIAGVLHAGRLHHNLVSMNGTVGHVVGRVREFLYTWEGEAILILSSDGLSSRWTPEQYPGLLGKHPALIAAVLYRDHCRGRDDVTVLVVRI
ncbi:ATP-binding SpoIIE family protein phosphatase [Terriglobus albidus]|uniref:ATP-binding SpoIIE family protein phosphatase n=1 Tax=Terriglobus albidus TaxID=1592106 RepID=UPI0021E02D41|nr:ATP-binding SpoIIE family protein phosphatase [Terriglobus albidus]